MTKILFIRVNITGQKSSDAMQPLIFAILDALTPSHYEREYIDDCIEELDYSKSADIVAISFGTFAAKRAYSIARKFKSKGCTIIMGGFHVSAEPNEALEYADSVVIGDAEPVWQRLLSDFGNKNLQKIYSGQHENKILHFIANREVFNKKKYFPANIVQWGRGCIHNCDFCSVKSFYKNETILRPIDEVIQEISLLDNKTIFFADDNLFHGQNLLKEFLYKLQPLKKKWACQVSIEIAKDLQLVKLMKDAGCVMVLIGIETLISNNLQKMNKLWNRNIDYAEAIKIFRRYGIMVYGTFIFGYESDKSESFSPAVDFAIKNKLFLANFNPLYPMPGTALYDRLKSENRLEFDKWWLHPGFYYGRTMFRPVNMKPEELEDGCFKSKVKFNSYKSIFLRLLDLKANAASIKNFILFLLVNIINRREIYRKQNKKLGQEK